MNRNKPIKSYTFWIILVIFCLIALFISKPGEAQFTIPEKPKEYIKAKPLFESDFIPQPKYLKESYSPALAKLKNGDLICFFYAGSSEGAPDVNIYSTIYHDGKWSEPKTSVTPRMISDSTRRFVRKIGNPAAFISADGKLHLFVTSVSMGGWAGARLNHLISSDNGEKWDVIENLKLSPFIDISNAARTEGTGLKDGGFYLPTYYEMIRCYPELLRFDKHGNFINKLRLNAHNDLMQPAIVPVSHETAFIYFRNKGDTDTTTYYQTTSDGGMTWDKEEKTNFEAPNSSLVAARLDKDLFLIACNQDDRSKFVIKYSIDGKEWQTLKMLENKDGVTFAYPAILVSGNTVDIIYSWNDRVALKHVRFNKEWVLSEVKR